MLSNGAKQAPNIVIDNNKGASKRYIQNMIKARVSSNAQINEVWIYEKGEITLIYKNGTFY